MIDNYGYNSTGDLYDNQKIVKLRFDRKCCSCQTQYFKGDYLIVAKNRFGKFDNDYKQIGIFYTTIYKCISYQYCSSQSELFYKDDFGESNYENLPF